MNIPFPSLTPRLVDSRWFNADNPRDEESDVAAMEQKYQTWLTSVGQRFADVNPLGKIAPEPMEEEAETDEEEGNDESDDTEDSHDEDDEEDIGADYSPSIPNLVDVSTAGLATPAQQSTNNNDIVMNDSNINSGAAT